MRKRIDVPQEKRQEIFHELISLSKENILPRGALIRVAKKHDFSRQTIKRIWENGLEPNKRSKSGRKVKWTDDLVKSRIKEVPWEKRTSLRSLAYASGIPVSILTRKIQKGLLFSSRSYLKPCLTERHKKLRFDFVMKSLNLQKNLQGSYDFSDMDHVVHVDEKWFFIDLTKKTYYHLDGEVPPERYGSRRHLLKVMFLAAVARPRGDFDGKIGIWPIVYFKESTRKSKYYDKGEMRPYNLKMNKTTYKHFLLDHLIPALKSKWPNRTDNIIIQQDNAPPHNIVNDDDVLMACSEGGWNIKILFQPPKSPDLNVLDLGFFNSIQALQNKNLFYSMEKLIDEVHTAYRDLPNEKINNIFYTLQKVHEQIILKKGGGDFKSLHMKKERKQLIESGIRNLSLSEEATMIIDTYLESQLLSDTEIATILLTFHQGLSSDESNPTDDTDDSDDIVEEGIVLASV